MRNKLKKNMTAYGLMLPALSFILLFTVFPVIRSIYLSLMDYRFGMTKPKFIGLDNYIRLFKTELFWKVMGNTLFFAVITLVPALLIGLGLALIVNRKSKVTGILRTLYFYPVILPMVAAASIWMFIYMANNGLWDQIVNILKFGPKDVLSHTNTVLPALAIMYIWKEAGYVMIFFLSGLQSISPDVLESARLDGAKGWTLFRHILFPLLGPTFLFVSTVELTNVFKLVDHIIIMTEGAPNNASTMLLYYIYQTGFTNFDYGLSSALTVILLVMLLIVALPRFIAQDKTIYYN
ncbi:MAG: sugar ABC transporter permease [Tissierellia bacterium]|nr:sugar ABC transporter permease [Tissierellia bacterium]